MVPYEPVHYGEDVTCPECGVEIAAEADLLRDDGEIECLECKEIIGYSPDEQKSMRIRIHEDTEA